MQRNYLIDLTFYAGSEDVEDTDKGMYVVKSDREMTKDEAVELFKKANKYCSANVEAWDDDTEVPEGFEASYDDGLNIETLTEGFAALVKDFATVEFLGDGKLGLYIEAVYEITQWE